MTDTVYRPTMSDALIIAERQVLPHGGDWIGAVAVHFGFDHDTRLHQEHRLVGDSAVTGEPEIFGRLIGLRPGLVVVDPESPDLISHRGLLIRAGSFFTTIMFNPTAERNLTIMSRFERTLPDAVAALTCSGGPSPIKLGINFKQWSDLKRWLGFWLPE